MSALYVTVFTDASQTALGDVEQSLSIANLSGSNAQTAVITRNGTLSTKRIRVYSEAAAWIAFGTDPDATGTLRIPIGADNPEYFTVPVGYKVAGVTR